MFHTLSIRTKITLLVGILLSGIVLLSIAGGVGLNRMRSAATELHDQGFGPAEQTLLLHKHLYKLRGDIYKELLLPEESEKIRADLAVDQARIDSTLAILGGMTTLLSDSIKAKITSTTAAIGEYRKAVGEISEKAKAGDVEFGKTSMKSGAAHLARKIVDTEAGALLHQVEAGVTAADQRATNTGHAALLFLVAISIALLLFGSVASFALIQQILNPLERIVSALDKIGRGDFREDSTELAGSGEIAHMAESLFHARAQLRQAFGAVGNSSSHAMTSATAQLEMTRRLTVEADANEREAHSAASAAEEASITLSTISKGASTSMSSLESVSAAIEEMSASVSEIARSADQTRAMTHQALDGARSASNRMSELATASKEIETVIEMIVEISEQTKLLALNATIEAARAGEAGKGFAVVAGEVKELAKGTADATEDIRKRVEAIRSSTSNAVQEIATVTGNMETLGQNISSIAGAVEQQSATTREISRNIGEAVQGTREIHRNLDAGSQAVVEISRDIQNVLGRGKVLREISVQASGLSERSAELSRELATEVGKFKV